MLTTKCMPEKKSRSEWLESASHNQRSSFSACELLDETLTTYYLRYLPECRKNVVKGLALLYGLQESQEEIYEAVTLRCRDVEVTSAHAAACPDEGYLRLQEEFENEKKAILNERLLLQNHLKNENHKITILEGCIYALPEPQRSVIVARYVERLPWPAIQHKLKRSASRIFCLHKEGIHGVFSSIRDFTHISEE